MADPILKVGGFTPLTSIDYPDNLAAVVFCQGCPWRCHYCHNQTLLNRSSESDLYWPEILDRLQLRARLLDAVVFSGGEPTLQKSLVNAIDEVTRLGFKTGLHTAGCYPDQLKKLLPRLNWVGLDIKTLEEDYEQITGVKNSGQKAWQSLELLQNSGIDFEVRVTVHSRLMPEKKLLELLKRLASMHIPNLALQQCQSQQMLHPTLGKSDSNWQASPGIDFAYEHFQQVTLRVA